MSKNKTKIYVDNYIPYYPVNKYCLHDTLLRNKYEKIKENKEEYFIQAKVINFDIIHHECRGSPLENSVKHYETIYQENLRCAKEEDINEFIGEAIKSKRKDLYINNNVLNKHFKLNQEIIEFKLKNKVLFSSMRKKELPEFKLKNKELFSSMKKKSL